MEISSRPQATHYHNSDRQPEMSEKVPVTVIGGNSSQLFIQQMSSSTMTSQQATVHDQLLPDLQLGQTQVQQAQAQAQSPSPTTTIPISRGSDPINNPCPTTFVTADTSSFKQVVQMLTGSDSTSNSPKQKPKPSATSKISTHYLDHHYPTTTTTPLSPSSSSSKLNFPIPPIRTVQNKKQQQQQQQQSHHHHHHHHHHQEGGFKLYERRNSLLKSSLMISPLTAPNNLFPYHHHDQQQKTLEILSPSVLDFPSLTLSSPVTPLSSEEEERAVIADKGFYFHPSPSPRGDDSEPPQLLSLFPLTSPQLRPSSSSSSSTTSAA